MNPDQINAAFEIGGALFALLNVREIRRDRQVKGCSWIAVLFFTSWGVWNCWYYRDLQQFTSAFASIGLVIVNAVWLAHLAWYAVASTRERVTASPQRTPDLQHSTLAEISANS